MPRATTAILAEAFESAQLPTPARALAMDRLADERPREDAGDLRGVVVDCRRDVPCWRARAGWRARDAHLPARRPPRSARCGAGPEESPNADVMGRSSGSAAPRRSSRFPSRRSTRRISNTSTRTRSSRRSTARTAWWPPSARQARRSEGGHGQARPDRLLRVPADAVLPALRERRGRRDHREPARATAGGLAGVRRLARLGAALAFALVAKASRRRRPRSRSSRCSTRGRRGETRSPRSPASTRGFASSDTSMGRMSSSTSSRRLEVRAVAALASELCGCGPA